MPKQHSFFDVDPLFDYLQSGQLILTSNQRLASRIRNAYILACDKKGHSVIHAPNVYSLNHWIEQQWHYLLTTAYQPAVDNKLLNQHQEQVLWEQIVGESLLGQPLLRPSATAQQAASAYRMIIEWQLSLDSAALTSSLSTSEDSRVWYGWAQTFGAECALHRLIPPAKLPDYLIAAYAERALTPVGSILLVGFQDVTPVHRALLGQAGSVEHYHTNQPLADVSLVQCQSSLQEYEAATVWAKQVLKNDPSATVAIVVPELNQQRPVVERVVMEVFEPGYNYRLSPPAVNGEASNFDLSSEAGVRRAPPFNISAGFALLDAPIIKAAMDLLALATKDVELSVIESICHSPFHSAGDSDTDKLMNLLLRCRQQKVFSLSVAAFRQLAAAVSDAFDDGDSTWSFSAALFQAAELCRESSVTGARSHNEWLVFFDQLLSIFGWPGSRPLDSIEYQQVTLWQQAQSEFSRLSLTPRPQTISLSVALSQWRGLLARLVFQPQTADSPLQILGILEAAGLQFSHLWLTSMSANQWPPAPSPNPLLPLALQREQNMPHASAEREYLYATKLTDQFLASAREVVVSCPTTIDENPVQISRIFSPYNSVELTQILGRPLQSLLPQLEIRRRFLESQAIESVPAGQAPSVAETEKIRGGTAIFSSQSACPFRAFAKHRLYIEALDEPEMGLSAADRGNLLHRSLELLWTVIQSQKTLKSMSDEVLQQRCADASQYAIDQFFSRSPKSLGAQFKSIEKSRLENLLLAWMEVEKQREDFVVLATETRKHFSFSELAFETRIDRIDQLSDGSTLIIDYKTGRCSPADWWGDRPEQPQLPLYAILSELAENKTASSAVEREADEAVGGIAFAEVNIENCALKGVGDEASPEPKATWTSRVQTDSGQLNWQQQKRHWQKVLTALAEDFISGKAGVDPKHDPAHSAKTCQYCDLKPLCRISHQELVQ